MPDIVDDIINIMDGPPPPRNARKRDNAMQSFLAEHHRLYEAMEKNSGDRIQEIDNYRNKHPRLTEVLDKKRSVMNQKVPSHGQSDKTSSDLNSRASRKLSKVLKLQANSLRKKSRVENTDSLHGVRKKCINLSRKDLLGGKAIFTKSNLKHISIGTAFSNASMFFRTKRQLSKLAGTEKVLNADVKTVNSVVLYQKTVNTSVGNLKTPAHSSKGSMISAKRDVDTDSCDRSMSSYNSFGSMQQEPMD